MSDCPIPCNLCGGRDVDVVGTRDRRGRPLRTTLCRGCGLVWSNPRPPAEAIRRYYSADYRLDYKGRATPSLRQVARSARGAIDRARELAPWLPPGARVLDAGAGGGEVVYVLRRFGIDASGLEPDEAYARHARETLGVPVATGFVHDEPPAAHRFDAVTMYHALEHVEDPLQTLSRLRSWLAPAGLLLVEVPNVEASCMAPGHRFHFAHFYNFNRQALEALGRRAGLEPQAAGLSPDGGNVTVIFRRGERLAPAAGDPENYARVAAALRRHTWRRHYLTRDPYLRPFGRLRAHLRDRRAAAGAASAREVIDRLLAAAPPAGGLATNGAATRL